MDNNSNMLQLCRLCLVKDDVNIPIFEEQGDIRQIFLKISSCLPVKVSRDDRLPKKICDGCSYKLDMLYEFWNTSANAEKQLLTWLGEAGMTSQMADGTISAVAQQIKPSDDFVKQEAIDPPDIQSDDDDKDYVFPEKEDEKSRNNVDEPPPKRARRTAAVKAAIAMDQDSDDDDSGEPMTKIEDDSEDSDNDDHEPAFVDVPSTSADDQPGPSGVGKDGVEAPSEDENDSEVKIQCGMCSVVFPNRQAFVQHSMKLSENSYHCCKCLEKFTDCVDLYVHYETHRTENVLEIEDVLEDTNEDMVLTYGENEETNEFVYVLDDSNVNEVVIEDDEPTVGSSNKTLRETVEIVNLEHGYFVTNANNYPLEDQEEVNNITDSFKFGSKKLFSSPRPRNPQPKKRNVVPDFSATNYVHITANEEIEVDHFKCLRCEQLFINKFGFFRHIEKGKCFINNCDACTNSFTKNCDFYGHYIAEHPDRAICNFCFRTFMYEKNVKEHMLRHLDQFRHRCEDCNKGFYTVREYRNHYKNRHMGIRHKCEVCGRSFADEYYFRRHMATHAKANNKIAIYELEEKT